MCKIKSKGLSRKSILLKYVLKYLKKLFEVIYVI